MNAGCGTKLQNYKNELFLLFISHHPDSPALPNKTLVCSNCSKKYLRSGTGADNSELNIPLEGRNM